MKSIKVTHLYPIFLPEPKVARSEGLHVSGIIRCIATEAGILKSEWAEDLSLTDVREIKDPTAILRINIGLAWEAWYIPNFIHDAVDHPGEVKLEGIYMTNDAESVSSVMITPEAGLTLMVHEVKATYKSTKTVGDLTSQWLWISQVKAYCKAAGTRYARLHVLFLCGDYKFPIRPVMEVWEIEFDQQELDDNWSLITDYRDERMKSEPAR